jgi:hypothetical protein
MGESDAATAATSPEARLARGLNVVAAGALAIFCLMALGMIFEPMSPDRTDHGEGRGWGIVIFVLCVPFVGLFWLAAEAFRRHAPWRWIAQCAALSPVWLWVIADVLEALVRLLVAIVRLR